MPGTFTTPPIMGPAALAQRKACLEAVLRSIQWAFDAACGVARDSALLIDRLRLHDCDKRF
jgi:hypothetical protein